MIRQTGKSFEIYRNTKEGTSMKYLVVLADGMADLPLEALGGKTPMEAANKPMMDRLVKEAYVGTVSNVPD